MWMSVRSTGLVLPTRTRPHDRVAAVFRLVGAGKSSGVPVDQTVGMATRFRNGKMWRMRSYPNPAEALEAVGLSEQDAHADS
jgi:ketosteroid isomerase-like protein